VKHFDKDKAIAAWTEAHARLSSHRISDARFDPAFRMWRSVCSCGQLAFVKEFEDGPCVWLSDRHGSEGAAIAMSNVMRGIDQALTVRAYLYQDVNLESVDVRRKFRGDMQEFRRRLAELAQPDSTLTSEEWSSRVRAGVAKLSPERRGPVVTCQSDADD